MYIYIYSISISISYHDIVSKLKQKDPITPRNRVFSHSLPMKYLRSNICLFLCVPVRIF